MPLKAFSGFEYGTNAGAVTGNAGSTLADINVSTNTTDIQVIATTPRTGSYCLQLTASASDTRWGWNTSTITGTPNRGVGVFAIRLPSLPSADTILAQITSTQQNGRFYYQQSSGQFAVAVEGGSLVAGGPVVQTNTWYFIEMYYDCSTTTGNIDWRVNGSAQTSATGTVTAGAAIDNYTMGGQSAVNQTFTALYDDVALWTDTAAITFPVGDYAVHPLPVDPAATVTLTGTATNFNTFSGATPTLTAWNATTARNAVDEVPPNLSASQDGIAQVTAATSDFIDIPMATYTLATGEAVAGIRLVACGWQAATTSATLGARLFNGTTEETLFAGTTAYTALANNSATPGWFCKLGTTANYQSQAQIDAISSRFGWSSDATPDIGIQAAYVELLVSVPAATPSVTWAPTASRRAHILPYHRYGEISTPPYVAASSPTSPTWAPAALTRRPVRLPHARRADFTAVPHVAAAGSGGSNTFSDTSVLGRMVLGSSVLSRGGATAPPGLPYAPTQLTHRRWYTLLARRARLTLGRVVSLAAPTVTWAPPTVRPRHLSLLAYRRRVGTPILVAPSVVAPSVTVRHPIRLAHARRGEITTAPLVAIAPTVTWAPPTTARRPLRLPRTRRGSMPIALMVTVVTPTVTWAPPVVRRHPLLSPRARRGVVSTGLVVVVTTPTVTWAPPTTTHRVRTLPTAVRHRTGTPVLPVVWAPSTTTSRGAPVLIRVRTHFRIAVQVTPPVLVTWAPPTLTHQVRWFDVRRRMPHVPATAPTVAVTNLPTIAFDSDGYGTTVDTAVYPEGALDASAATAGADGSLVASQIVGESGMMAGLCDG